MVTVSECVSGVPRAFARIVNSGTPALLPDVRNVADILAFDEHAEVLLDEEASGLAAAASPNADPTFLVFDFNNHGGHFSHTPRGAALAVLGEPRHRVRDRWEVRLLAHDPEGCTRGVIHNGDDDDDDNCQRSTRWKGC